MDDLIERQRRQIDELRERVRQLEEVLMPSGVVVPLEWGLTAQEARVFSHLTTRDMATQDSVVAALYSDRGGEIPDPKIVDVFICRIRAKVARFGVTISTIRGQGWSLEERRRFGVREAVRT